MTDQMTRICLVRHGETQWNTHRRLQGHLDIPLNATGRAQATATADALRAERFTAIYTSDLARAQQTATAIADTGHPPPSATPALRERHYGVFQGLTHDEARVRHPDAWQRFRARDPAFVLPGNGESLTQLHQRVAALLETLRERHRGEQVLLVTHGGVLDIAHRIAAGLALEAPRNFPIPNAAINRIIHDGEQWRMLEWATQQHLGNTLDELPNT